MMPLTISPSTWCTDLNPCDQNQSINTLNPFDWAALVMFVLCAAFIPYKQQPALIFIVLGCLFSLGGSQRKYFFKNVLQSPIALSALALYGAVLISFSYSNAPSDQKFKFILAYREVFFIPFIFVFFSTFARYRHRATLVILSVCCAVLAMSVASFFLYKSGAKGLFNFPVGQTYLFHSYIVQNVMTSLLVLFFMLQVKSSSLFSLRWFFYSVLAFLGIVNIFFMVQGRTGHLTLAACCLIFAWFSFSKKIKIASVVIVIVSLVVLLNTNNPLREAFKRTQHEITAYQKTGEATSAGSRIEFWKHAIKKIHEKPLLGYGAGSFRHQYAEHIKANNQAAFWPGTHHPHNEFLFLWHDAGMLALLCFVGLLSSLLWQAHKSSNQNTKTMRYGIVMSLIIYSLVDVPLFNSPEALFFVLMIACFFQLNMKKASLVTAPPPAPTPHAL